MIPVGKAKTTTKQQEGRRQDKKHGAMKRQSTKSN